MIHDKLENWKTYEKLGEQFEKAFQFIGEFIKAPKGDGDYLITDNMKAIVTSYETEESENGVLECHREFIDLHYMLSGTEVLEWRVNEPPVLKQPYNSELDCALYENCETVRIPVLEGEFVLLWPQDYHKPGCIYQNAQSIRKIIVKIKVKAE